MKNVKNLIFALAASAVVAITTAGCSQEDSTVKVRIGMWPQVEQESDTRMFNVWEQRFEADHPEYDIVAEPYTYDSQTVQAMGLAQTLPTVFQTYFTEPDMLIKNRYIRDVTDLVKEVGYYDDMNVSMREALEDDEGRLYGVPRDGYGFGLLLNLKTLNYYGLVEGDATTHEYKLYDDSGNPLYPTTFDQLAEWCVEISTISGGTTAGTMLYTTNRQGGWLLANLAWNFGAELQVQNADGSYQGNLASEEMVDTIEWIQNLKANGGLVEGTNFTYNDWYNYVGGTTPRMAMAFCGNDVVQNAVTQGAVDREDIAFVPMPSGPGGQYSLYGGTPYVFASNASDEQVRGALMFLEYMGRSPIMSEAQKTAMQEGKETSKNKNEPILPSIRPWTNSDFNEYQDELDEEYVNVNMEYFNDFFDTIETIKKEEVKYYAQEMYEQLDYAVVEAIKDPYRSRDIIMSQLETLNTQYNKNFD